MSTRIDPATRPDTADPRDAIFDADHLKQNLQSRAGRGSVTVLVFAVLKMALQLGTTAMLARLVAPDQHGIVALAMPAILIGSHLSEFGLAEAVIQRDRVTHRMASALFWMNALIGLALALVVVGLAVPAAAFYGEPKVTAIFVALAPTIFFAAAGAQFVAILRRQMQIRKVETAMLIATVLAAVTAVGLAFAGFSYWAIAAQIMLQPVFALFLLQRAAGWLPSWPSLAALSETRSFLAFGGLLAGSRLITQVTQNLGLIIVGRAFSTFEAGLYYRSWNLANLPQQRAVSPLASVFLAAFSRVNDDPVAFGEVFKRAATRIGLITLPVAIGMCATADLIVQILLGKAWLASAPILAWLGIITLQAGAMATLQWVLIAVGAVKAMFVYRLALAVVTGTALLIGFRYGITGMVAANMLALFFILIPALCLTAIHYSPLSAGAVAEAFLPDYAVAAAGISGLMVLRKYLPDDIAVFPEFLISALFVFVITLVRVLPNRGLRQDVAKVLRLKRRAG